jgi:hypothetical protein
MLLVACSGSPKTPDSAPGGSGSSGGGGVGGQAGAATGGFGGAPPPQVPPRFVPGDCNLDAPAFCETFEKEFPGGRGGPLDEKEWSVARWGLPMTGGFRVFSRRAATSVDEGVNTPSFCGTPFDKVLPPDDLRLCEGVDAGGFASKQLHEVFNDDDSFAFTSLRLRQLFDFTNRTGTIVFDVDAKRNVNFDAHGWWIELWITPEPVPMPYHGAPTVASYARRALGFQVAPVSPECFHQEQPVCNQVGRVVIQKDYKITRDAPIETAKGFSTADGKLNRFKVLLSRERAELWASNVDSKGELSRVATVENLDLDWTRGYIHFQHAKYNAGKVQASSSQTYRWDNIAFDGPTYETPRGFDALDAADPLGTDEIPVQRFGYELRAPDGSNAPVEVIVPGVDLGDATHATLNFNVSTQGNRELEYRLNQNEWKKFKTPEALGSDFMLRAFSIEVPITELVAGDNTVGFRVPDVTEPEGIGNVDLTLAVSK